MGRIPIADQPIDARAVADELFGSGAGETLLGKPKTFAAVDIHPAPPGHIMYDDGVREPVGAWRDRTVIGVDPAAKGADKVTFFSMGTEEGFHELTPEQAVARGLMPDPCAKEAGPLRAPAVQPPILREQLYAREVSFMMPNDFARSKGQSRIGVTLQLTATEDVHDEGRVSNFVGVTLRLPAEYAGQFCAGQKFWLTINPAGKDE